MENIHREFIKNRPEPGNEEIAQYLKYSKDPIAFIRDYNYGFDSEKSEYKYLQLYDFQEIIIENIHNKNAIIKKSRQMYISQLMAAYCAWNLIFKQDYNILVISINKELANYMINRIRAILEHYSIIFDYNHDVIIDNKSEIRLANGSFIKAASPTGDAGRGYSIDMLIIDEAAFIKNVKDIWMGAGMALSQNNGNCIMISTPNKVEDFFHNVWNRAINSENTFTPIHLDWTMNPNYTKDLEIRDGKHWSSWYENNCMNLGRNEQVIDRELNAKFIGDNKPNSVRINFRINTEIYDKLIDKIGNNSNISDYLRKLIEKDLI